MENVTWDTEKSFSFKQDVSLSGSILARSFGLKIPHFSLRIFSKNMEVSMEFFLICKISESNLPKHIVILSLYVSKYLVSKKFCLSRVKSIFLISWVLLCKKMLQPSPKFKKSGFLKSIISFLLDLELSTLWKSNNFGRIYRDLRKKQRVFYCFLLAP